MTSEHETDHSRPMRVMVGPADSPVEKNTPVRPITMSPPLFKRKLCPGDGTRRVCNFVDPRFRSLNELIIPLPSLPSTYIMILPCPEFITKAKSHPGRYNKRHAGLEDAVGHTTKTRASTLAECDHGFYANDALGATTHLFPIYCVSAPRRPVLIRAAPVQRAEGRESSSPEPQSFTS